MEYVFNWMVLILTLGGIAIIAFLCYVDLLRSGSHAPSAVSATIEPSALPVESVNQQSGPSLQLSYCRDGIIHYVQSIPSEQIGYIGTESYAGFGPGMPVRCAEIVYNNQAYSCTNLDWQTELSVCNDHEEVVVQMGQTQPIKDGTEIRLPSGWNIQCRIDEGQA